MTTTPTPTAAVTGPEADTFWTLQWAAYGKTTARAERILAK